MFCFLLLDLICVFQNLSFSHREQLFLLKKILCRLFDLIYITVRVRETVGVIGYVCPGEGGGGGGGGESRIKRTEMLVRNFEKNP